MPAIGPPRPLRRQKPSRRPRHRYVPSKRKPPVWRRRMILAGGLGALTLVLWAVIARNTAPGSNTALNRFDAIIVLGTPADRDGNPTPEMLARVSEGVREYDRGVAPRLILTGGHAHNRFVEAEAMARAAEAEGIPASAIVLEPAALNTIQNACYSARIMNSRGWRSAEVVSSAWHLPRAAIIFSRQPILWRTHAAPGVEQDSSTAGAVEVLKTLRYLSWASWADRCEP